MVSDEDFTIEVDHPIEVRYDELPDTVEPLSSDIWDDPTIEPVAQDPAGAELAPGYYGGEVADAAEHWHLQEQSHSCAVVAQEFILDDITGVDHSEAELTALAEQNGWYVPGQGTAWEDVGNVLEAYGVPTEQHEGAGVDDLATALANGEHVIVGVDSSEIIAPGFDPADPLDDYPGIPGQGADHAIQVIGLDNSDPANPMVIVNDPGLPDGQGGALPLATFQEAWDDSGNFMMTASAA